MSTHATAKENPGLRFSQTRDFFNCMLRFEHEVDDDICTSFTIHVNSFDERGEGEVVETLSLKRSEVLFDLMRLHIKSARRGDGLDSANGFFVSVCHEWVRSPEKRQLSTDLLTALPKVVWEKEVSRLNSLGMRTEKIAGDTRHILNLKGIQKALLVTYYVVQSLGVDGEPSGMHDPACLLLPRLLTNSAIIGQPYFVYAHIRIASEERHKCAACSRFALGLQACSRCDKVRYCDRDCQRKHWKVHKKLCVACE
jgi:hypothetical protein